MKSSTAAGALAWLGLLAAPLYANWGGDAGGSVGTGTFQCLGTAQVEMQDEDLNIRLYKDRAKVQVKYVMHNTGGAVDVKAGFPCLGVRSEKRKKNYLEIEDYRLTADGKEIPYQTEKGDASKWKTVVFDQGLRDQPDLRADGGPLHMWWLTSTVHFAAGETKHLQVGYESLYEYSEGGSSDNSDFNNDYFRYLLSTAGAWKGPIQHGRVVIQAVTLDRKSLSLKPPNRFRPTADGWIWNFTNLAPTLQDNIEVCMNNRFFTQSNFRTGPNPEASWYSFEDMIPGKDDSRERKWKHFYFNYHGYTAQASSEAAGFPVKNIDDFKADTAWVAGKNGGIGESITLTLNQPAHIQQIGIIPGYGKSKDIYFANNRVEVLEVSVNGGQAVTARLPDEYNGFGPFNHKGFDLIDLGKYEGDAKTITLTVKKVYPGSRHNDTCISEVLLRKSFTKRPEIRNNR